MALDGPSNRHLIREASLALLVLAVAGCVFGLGALAYHSIARDALRATESRLTRIAEAQVSSIGRWRAELHADATVIAADHALGGLVRDQLAGPDAKRRQILHDRLASYIEAYGLGAATLLSPDGTPAIAIAAPGFELDKGVGILARRAIAESRAVFSDLHIDEEQGGDSHVDIDIAVPLRAEADGPVVGVIALTIDPETVLYPLLRDWPLLERGMEIVLAQQTGDQIALVNPLAHRTGGPLIYHRTTSEPDLPSARAARGERGVLRATDYRGIKVLAAVQAIPGSNWFLIAKLDQVEVNSGLRRIALAVTGAGLLVLVVVYALVRARLGRLRADHLADQLQAREDQAELLEHTNELAARLQAVLDNTPIGLAIVSMERTILEANLAFGAIFGVSTQALTGRSTEVLYADIDSFNAVGARAYPPLHRGATFDEVVPMRNHDGRDILVRLSARLIDTRLHESNVVWAAEDVTDRVRYDQELAKARDMSVQNAADLARSNAELEQFAYVVSHDLRQPLRQVSSYVSLLERQYGGKLDEDAHMFIGFARDGAQRMDRLIVDLLEFSRIGRTGGPIEAVDLTKVVELAMANLAITIAECGATVTVTSPLPTVEGRGDELVRLFQNLIGNAVKYRAPGRPCQVAIAAAQEGNRVRLSVRDNGVGIAPEHFERIFGIFQRLHSPGEYEGTGIGLAICRKIVDHHHGRIEVASTLGEGSTFQVVLPSRQPAIAEATASA